MTHDAKYDWWIVFAIALGLLELIVGGDYWIAGPVLLVLVICAYPQSYVTTPDGLQVRAGLVRRFIPYRAITFVGPADGEFHLAPTAGTVRIQYGRNCQWIIAPADPDLFFEDLAQRAPHLARRGQALKAVFA